MRRPPPARPRSRRASPEPSRWSRWSHRARRRAGQTSALIAFRVARLDAADGRSVDALLAQVPRERIAMPMRREDPLGARLAYRAQPTGPVGVVAEREAAVERAPAPLSPDPHRPRREGALEVAESLHPRQTPRGQRRKDPLPGARPSLLRLGHGRRREHADAGLAIDRRDRLD